jgi:hypothetical protein
MVSSVSNWDEKTISDSQKISFFEYLFVFVLIIFSGHANRYFILGSIKDTPITVLLFLLLGIVLALKWKIVFDRQFLFLITGFLIYFIAISLKFNEVQPTFFLSYVIQFFVVFSAVKSLKINFLKIYEILVFYLSILGLIFWLVQTFLGGDTLYYYVSKIPSIIKYSYVSGNGLNVFLYSVQPTYTSLIYSDFLPRNCGFAWEPGGFAVYICIAIFCNLFFSRSNRIANYRFWILTAALVSTQSTTGYLMFLVIIFYYFYRKMSTLMIFLFPVIVAFLVFLFSLPFMSKKIVRLYNETNELDVMVMRTIGRQGDPVTPQRFTSFMITWRDFRKNPILGLGGHMEESWTAKIGARISPITGIGNLMAQFGIIGCLFFIIMTLKSSFYFSDIGELEIKYLLFIIMVFSSISYSLILHPLFMVFWMFQLFGTKDIGDKTKGKSPFPEESDINY